MPNLPGENVQPSEMLDEFTVRIIVGVSKILTRARNLLDENRIPLDQWEEGVEGYARDGAIEALRVIAAGGQISEVYRKRQPSDRGPTADSVIKLRYVESEERGNTTASLDREIAHTSTQAMTITASDRIRHNSETEDEYRPLSVGAKEKILVNIFGDCNWALSKMALGITTYGVGWPD